jgi:hypothetical protein
LAIFPGFCSASVWIPFLAVMPGVPLAFREGVGGAGSAVTLLTMVPFPGLPEVGLADRGLCFDSLFAMSGCRDRGKANETVDTLRIDRPGG